MSQPSPNHQTLKNGKTDPGIVMGTAGYMSPEQVRGKPADHRADNFAFGAILYEMLTGRRAFQRSTSAETMTAILNDDPPSISQIVQTTPLGLQRVVHRCLEKNPEQRFQSASDLAFADDSNPTKLQSYSAIYTYLARCGPHQVAYSAFDREHRNHIARTDIVTGSTVRLTDGPQDIQPT